MRLVLVGPPGSGKGTQAQLLTKRLGLPYIGTGDILREAIRNGSPAGKLAEPAIKKGNLVPDDLVNKLVEDLFASSNAPQKFVFDGYPRTLAQAIAFDALLTRRNLKLDAVLDFHIEDEEVVRRIAGRYICSNSKCNAPYHLLARAPKVPGVCDVCGSPLMQRADDVEETIRARLKVFHDNTDDLVRFYKQAGLLHVVPTTGQVEAIYSDIMRFLPKQAADSTQG
jgi:adenylate kinase